MAEDIKQDIEYGSDSIRTLDWKEHIRRRPGMYIGKLGDGTHADDGIYVLLKEVIDNAIDEFMMGYGKQVIIDIEDGRVSVRDYGRGIPLDKVVDVSSKMNTGAKYDSKAFKKSVGLNGVGIKAVNALSSEFRIEAYREGECKSVTYTCGNKTEESAITPTDQSNGTWVSFKPDNTIFVDYKYREEFVVALIKNYTYLNSGLTFIYNGVRYASKNGLVDLLNEKMTATPLYPMIHLKGDDIEVVITHMEKNFIRSSTGSTPYSGGRISRHSKNPSRVPSKNFTPKTSNMPTFATAWWRLSASRWKNPYSSPKPKPNSARATWDPTDQPSTNSSVIF